MFVSSQKDFCREDKKVQMAHYVVIYYKNIYLYELRVWVPVIRVEFCHVNKSRLLASWILSEFKRNFLIIYVRLYLVLFLENSSPSGKKKKQKTKQNKTKKQNFRHWFWKCYLHGNCVIYVDIAPPPAWGDVKYLPCLL